MYYLYLLFSPKTNRIYIGTTPDLKKRFYSHNRGKNIATKFGVPWKLVYYEAYSTKADAIRREQNLKKYGQGLRRLKERIALVDKS